MSIVRNNSATLIVGDSGTGKSSLLATYADYVWQKYRKITLLYVSDGGGFGDSVEALIQRGIIWVWRLKTRGNPFETCARASRGFWPKKMINPATGESSPSCSLAEPVKMTYTLFCPKGHEVRKRSIAKSLGSSACPTCDVQTSIKNGSVDVTSKTTPGFEQVGARCYDSLTSMEFWIMLELAHRVGSGDLAGEKTALGGQIFDGDDTFGGNNRSHYGFAQIRAQEWLSESTAIPGMVAPPIWTALEHRADDDRTNLPIYGPKIAGNAKTSEVPSWVGNCLGTRTWKEDGKDVFKLHLKEYRDTDGIPHLCKVRAIPGILPDFLADDPDAPPFTEFNLGHLFTLLDSAGEKALKEAAEKYPDAPGLPTGSIGEVEEDDQQTAAGTTVSTTASSSPRAGGGKSTIAKAASAVARVGRRPARGRAAAPVSSSPSK